MQEERDQESRGAHRWVTSHRWKEWPSTEGGRTPAPQTPGGRLWVKVSLSPWEQEVEGAKGYCFLCEMAGLVRRREILVERWWPWGNVIMGHGGEAELTHPSTLPSSQVPTQQPLPRKACLTSWYQHCNKGDIGAWIP